MRVSRICVAVTGFCVVLGSGTAVAQHYDYADLPDWSGVWGPTANTVFDQATIQPPGANANDIDAQEFPPYSEEWQAKYDANRALKAQGQFPDPISTCGTPAGFPRMMNLPGASEFVVRPEQVWILTEDGPNIMRIYTDGRDHPGPNDRWATYSGESVGHWERDTLVFETISLKAEMILDRTGLVLSDQARIVTRMRKTAENRMEARFAIHDPVALTDTWNVVIEYECFEPGTRMIEFACAENNRNPVDASGRTLTLDREGNILDQL
jgi:hypothetical protein